MTAHQLYKISLEHLRPGMYVGNVFNARGVLLYSANTLIVDYAQIEALRRQGVTTVGINLTKGTGSDMIPEKIETAEGEYEQQEDALLERPPVFDELKVQEAVALRSKTLDTVHEMMAAVATGRMFSLRTVTDSVNSIIDLMLGDPDLLLNINRMKAACPVTYVHSVNVAVLMVGFAAALGYTRSALLDAGIGGILHDIGKTRLPADLLLKQGTCTRQEYELFKRHPELGLEIVAKNRSPVSPAVRSIIGQHHERISGGGYPRQLRGTHIHELALLCAIADMYDSLTTDGMYHRLYLPQEALALIFQGADDEFPRRLVEHFTKLLGIYPVGSFVKLDSGEMGVVVRNNRQKLLMPVVKVLFDEAGILLATPYIKDLSVADASDEMQAGRVVHSVDPRSFNIPDNHYYLQG
jgi:putative nucleotidyltransferase with HDIG domain